MFSNAIFLSSNASLSFFLNSNIKQHLHMNSLFRSLATTTSPTSTTSTPTAHSLPVRRFPAFGNSSNDCSVRFSSMKHEQTGYWTCAARNSTNDPFTATVPAKLTIVNDQGTNREGSPFASRVSYRKIRNASCVIKLTKKTLYTAYT